MPACASTDDLALVDVAVLGSDGWRDMDGQIDGLDGWGCGCGWEGWITAHAVQASSLSTRSKIDSSTEYSVEHQPAAAAAFPGSAQLGGLVWAPFGTNQVLHAWRCLRPGPKSPSNSVHRASTRGGGFLQAAD